MFLKYCNFEAEKVNGNIKMTMSYKDRTNTVTLPEETNVDEIVDFIKSNYTPEEYGTGKVTVTLTGGCRIFRINIDTPERRLHKKFVFKEFKTDNIRVFSVVISMETILAELEKVSNI